MKRFGRRDRGGFQSAEVARRVGRQIESVYRERRFAGAQGFNEMP
jgi:hypothetical protein